MDSGSETHRLGRELEDDFLERPRGIFHADLDRWCRFGKIGRDKNSRRFGAPKLRGVFRVAEEGQVTFASLAERRRAGDTLLRIAHDLTAGNRRQFLDGKRHRLARISSSLPAEPSFSFLCAMKSA